MSAAVRQLTREAQDLQPCLARVPARASTVLQKSIVAMLGETSGRLRKPQRTRLGLASTGWTALVAHRVLAPFQAAELSDISQS